MLWNGYIDNGQLHWDLKMCVFPRNWCAYVATKTVSCVVEDGVETYVKPDYHPCAWGSGQCSRVVVWVQHSPNLNIFWFSPVDSHQVWILHCVLSRWPWWKSDANCSITLTSAVLEGLLSISILWHLWVVSSASQSDAIKGHSLFKMAWLAESSFQTYLQHFFLSRHDLN